MPNESHESLERFIRGRSIFMFANGSGKWSFRVNIAAGYVLLSAAFTALFVMLLVRAPSDALWAAMGPGIAGLVNLYVGHSTKRRFLSNVPVSWALSVQGRALVWTLIRSYRVGPIREMSRLSHMIRKPQQETLELLDRSAFVYNRIVGLLQPGTSVELPAHVIVAAQTAADEAMCAILNSAGSLDEYPESGEAHRVAIARQTELLSELAERISSLAAAHGEAPIQQTSSSMQRVLDELRLEQLARSELRFADTEEASQNRLSS